MASTQDRSAALWLACVRIMVGILLLRAGLLAFGEGPQLGPRIEALVRADLEQRFWPVRIWGGRVLLENPNALAFLWKLGLTVCGLGLILGALVRPLAACASVCVLHGLLYGDAPGHGLHGLLLVCLLASAYAGHSRLALDPGLDRSLPHWLTWAPKRRRFG